MSGVNDNMHQLFIELGKVNLSDVISNGGSGLLSSYNNNLFEVLQSTYPEHNWKKVNFSYQRKEDNSKKPPGYWQDPTNRVIQNQLLSNFLKRAFLDEVLKGKDLTSIEGWNVVTKKVNSCINFLTNF
jgi:hypothetical protein